MDNMFDIEVRYDNGYINHIIAFSLTTARAKAFKLLCDDQAEGNNVDQIAIDGPDGYTVEVYTRP